MEKRVTPDEIPALTNEALKIGEIFLATVGTIPASIPQLLVKLPSIFAFLKQIKPILEVIVKEIKD
jgi:phage-related minor tail protein